MSMNKFDTYLFDADGTLIDTRDMISECFYHTLKKYGNREVTQTEIDNIIGIPYRNQLEIFIGDLSDEKYFEIRADHIEHQLSIYKDSLKLCPGVLETLKVLKENNKKIGIVTSRSMTTLGIFLEHFDLLQYFEHIITPNETKKHKPHPEPVFKALDMFNSEAENTIFIGDASFDIDSGNGAGVTSCFTKWSPADLFDSKPDYFIDDMREILEF